MLGTFRHIAEWATRLSDNGSLLLVLVMLAVLVAVFPGIALWPPRVLSYAVGSCARNFG